MRRTIAVLFVLAASVLGDGPKDKSARDALKPLNIWFGSWKATGSPEGTAEEKQKGHWQETIAWECSSRTPTPASW